MGSLDTVGADVSWSGSLQLEDFLTSMVTSLTISEASSGATGSCIFEGASANDVAKGDVEEDAGMLIRASAVSKVALGSEKSLADGFGSIICLSQSHPVA